MEFIEFYYNFGISGVMQVGLILLAFMAGVIYFAKNNL